MIVRVEMSGLMHKGWFGMGKCGREFGDVQEEAWYCGFEKKRQWEILGIAVDERMEDPIIKPFRLLIMQGRREGDGINEAEYRQTNFSLLLTLIWSWSTVLSVVESAKKSKAYRLRLETRRLLRH